jgi:hypothetical protein
MRFVKMFLMFLLVGVVIIASGILMVFEGRLWWVGNKLSDDFLAVKRLVNQESNRYRKDCIVEGAMVFGKENETPKSSVLGFRLRFTDEANYVIEAVCRESSIEPIILQRGSLGFGIKKLAGSGLMYPLESESVSALVLIGDEYVAREVGIMGTELVSRLVDPKNWRRADTDAPETVCEGWGKVCCDPATQVGNNDPEERVLDCRGQCYASCQNRPIVVYFNSDPVLDMASRQLKIQGSTVEVSFGFEIIDQDSQIGKITLDYGDGEIFVAKNNQEIVRHTYTCQQDSCEYLAKIEAVDSEGLTLLQPRLQMIKIIQTEDL